MSLTRALHRVLAFLTGADTVVGSGGHVALLALFPRRLTDSEIAAIIADLTEHQDLPISRTDIQVAITMLTDRLPSVGDTARVRRRLEARGCAVFDDFDIPGPDRNSY